MWRGKTLRHSKAALVVGYIFVDLICVGLGMGVPFFCIMLGFPLGWYFAERMSAGRDITPALLNRILKLSMLSAGVTFIMMAGIWGPHVFKLFQPGYDYGRFGHPLIFYDARISFIGWLVLMIIVSPILQMVATVFAAMIKLGGRGRS